MIDLEQIDDTIKELESDTLTLGNCGELASLCIIKDYYSRQGSIQGDNLDDKVDIQSLLAKYMIDRDIISLNILLNKMWCVLSELYHTCDTPEERNEFKEFIDSLQSITNPTTIEGL